MKGVPVKFRAKTEKGDFVYGDLIQGRYIECVPKIKPVGKRAVYVDKDSVAQLCGYDADGNEVYEGDKLTPIDTPDNSPKRKGRPKKDKIFIPRLQCDLVLDDYVNVTGDYE